MVCDADDAADIVQEVFMAMYQKLKKGKKIEYPKSWLYKATLNKSIDINRSRQKLLKIEFSAVKNKAVEENASDVNNELIQHALNRLPAKEKAMAILYSEGMSYKEISSVLGIKFTSVGKTLTRTLEKLGKELKTLEHELH